MLYIITLQQKDKKNPLCLQICLQLLRMRVAWIFFWKAYCSLLRTGNETVFLNLGTHSMYLLQI